VTALVLAWARDENLHAVFLGLENAARLGNTKAHRPSKMRAEIVLSWPTVAQAGLAPSVEKAIDAFRELGRGVASRQVEADCAGPSVAAPILNT